MKDLQGSFAQVKVEGESNLVIVPVSSGKPPIPAEIREKWQKIVDLVADILQVPSGLITQFTEDNLEILVASRTEGNPYKRDDHDSLGIGMFCETVAGKRRELQVADSTASPYWAANPHTGFGMKAYMGVPIEWDDGEVFGTFCMLTDKANSVEARYLDLLRQFKAIIEADLNNIVLKAELEERLTAKELEIREAHHRIKNQLNLLISFISVQAGSSVEEETRNTLKEIQHRMKAVSMIHESMCRSAAACPSGLDEYLTTLCGYIIRNLVSGDIRLSYDIEAIQLSTEKQITIALLLSELITNSVKYAFAGGGEKRIEIKAKLSDEGELFFTYRDNGKGIPESSNPATAKSLGMTIIRTLVKQLQGRMTARNDGGAVFEFIFKP